ncbi:Protein transport protein ssh1 [Yamadazyma tenuis]|uniref:Translocon Sec61/SecY plug domain-containing protein n=1 Tax=Candida tenuis (strain ATCC 10573 / BCRC 21748 / CBS 615 / JCM 9827 / NBRC 10315 / NRRL Y-1498 / VKM Y-70) TaxID=590646 RepID=G3B1E1_CANTC|nr:uncharacterized protein CANTEDRAFT_121180 [Yamadazyma tenuis ATCC 10573]EGV64949.1 hypothetical protein CANTEDRAFT_121180 [Yamadazyma tenuis ATCC 10573]WEJ97746.1 Protein transport protein ssh1 [Yamadazyma tenuis]
MSGFRLLDLVKFFLPILPEVELPYEKVTLDEKIIFTVSSGIIFLLGQLPLYGLKPNAYLYIQDPFSDFRSIFAMEKGTLLELGLLPVLTSAFIWQLAVGFKVINVNLSLRSERELFQTGQKLTTYGLSIVYLAGLLFSNYYDESLKSYVIGGVAAWGSLFLIFVQVFIFNFFVTSIVEVIDKGLGFGSGALTLLTVQYTSNFVRDLIGLEILPLKNSNKTESFGSLANLVKNFSFNPKTLGGNVLNSFTRFELPNLTQAYIAVASILVVVGLNNFRIELPIRSTKMRGMANVYPIKLLYTGGLPLLFTVTILANLQVFGYFIASIFQYRFLGSYELVNTSLVLNNGILYYFTSPSVVQAVLNPLRTVVYSLTVVFLSTWFANHWALFSGSAPKDISKQFKEQGISISGKRDVSITKELSRIIPVAAVSGAFLLSVTAIVGEVLGGKGKGIAGVVGICAAFSIMEDFVIESQQSGGTSQLLGALSGYQ